MGASLERCAIELADRSRQLFMRCRAPEQSEVFSGVGESQGDNRHKNASPLGLREIDVVKTLAKTYQHLQTRQARQERSVDQIGYKETEDFRVFHVRNQFVLSQRAILSNIGSQSHSAMTAKKIRTCRGHSLCITNHQ